MWAVVLACTRAGSRARAILCYERVVAIEGLGWLLPDFEEHCHDRGRRERLLTIIHLLETEASLLGVSAHAHMMAMARKEA